MSNYMTIRIDRDLKAKLDLLKEHPRESYNSVIGRILYYVEEYNLKEFVRKAQMKSMKKLWDNKYDNNGAWEKL